MQCYATFDEEKIQQVTEVTTHESITINPVYISSKRFMI